MVPEISATLRDVDPFSSINNVVSEEVGINSPMPKNTADIAIMVGDAKRKVPRAAVLESRPPRIIKGRRIPTERARNPQITEDGIPA